MMYDYSSYFNRVMQQKAQDNGEACEHWIDEEYYWKLKKEDKKNGTHKAEKYRITTYSPLFIIKPLGDDGLSEVDISIRCDSNNLTSGVVPPCENKFPKTTQAMKEHFKDKD